MAALPLAFWAGGIIVLSKFGKIVLFAEKKNRRFAIYFKNEKRGYGYEDRSDLSKRHDFPTFRTFRAIQALLC